MNRKRCMVVLCMMVLLISLMGCSLPGKGPVLTVDGVEITLGKSTPNSFVGFDIHVGSSLNSAGFLDAYSWLLESLYAKKYDDNYARLRIYNPSGSSKRYVDCPIYGVSFHMYSEEKSYWTENNMLVNGIDFYGMDSDEVKEAMQEYELTGEDADTGELTYTQGDYEYGFTFDETTGVVDEVSVEMMINKSY